MTAGLAIEAASMILRDARPGAGDSEPRGNAARYRERLSTPRLVEAMGTVATMVSCLLALVVFAGEWLGDAGVTDVAEAVAHVAMPHVDEVSSTIALAGS